VTAWRVALVLLGVVVGVYVLVWENPPVINMRILVSAVGRGGAARPGVRAGVRGVGVRGPTAHSR
jgi:hypothetical protein